MHLRELFLKEDDRSTAVFAFGRFNPPTIGHKKLLDKLSPSKIHILVDGRIVESGGPDLAETIENKGPIYEALWDQKSEVKVSRNPGKIL